MGRQGERSGGNGKYNIITIYRCREKKIARLNFPHAFPI